jgi:hypothetical protein
MPYRTPGWRIAAGIVISLLLHAAALVFLRLPEPRIAADGRTWLTQVEVRIVPPPARPEPEPEPERTPKAAPKPARLAAEARPRPKRRDERASAQQQAAQAAYEGQLVLPPAEPGPAQPFDREAAKAAARDIAGELEAPPTKLRETRDQKLARQIQNAARPNCKDGIPGGLLAPLYLLMEKKDSGCKW